MDTLNAETVAQLLQAMFSNPEEVAEKLNEMGCCEADESLDIEARDFSSLCTHNEGAIIRINGHEFQITVVDAGKR